MTGATLQKLEMSVRAQANWRWRVAIEELEKLVQEQGESNEIETIWFWLNSVADTAIDIQLDKLSKRRV